MATWLLKLLADCSSYYRAKRITPQCKCQEADELAHVDVWRSDNLIFGAGIGFWAKLLKGPLGMSPCQTLYPSPWYRKFSSRLSTERLIHPTLQSELPGDTNPRILAKLDIQIANVVFPGHVFSPFFGREKRTWRPGKGAFTDCEYLHIVGYKTAIPLLSKTRLFTSRGGHWMRRKLLILRLDFSTKKHGRECADPGWSRESFGIRLKSRVSTWVPNLAFGFHRIRIYQIVFKPVSEMRVLR